MEKVSPSNFRRYFVNELYHEDKMSFGQEKKLFIKMLFSITLIFTSKTL